MIFIHVYQTIKGGWGNQVWKPFLDIFELAQSFSPPTKRFKQLLISSKWYSALKKKRTYVGSTSIWS